MIDLKAIQVKLEGRPEPDIAICAACGWRGHISKCEVEQDGDWESGYFSYHLCPRCEDGGDIHDYTMSFLQSLRYMWWSWRNKRKEVSCKKDA